MAESNSAEKDVKLSDIFDTIWGIWNYTEQTDDSQNSEQYQTKVREGLMKSERAVLMVNHLQLFSGNEDLEELFYGDFLRLCKNYGLTDVVLSEEESNDDNSQTNGVLSSSSSVQRSLPPRPGPPDLAVMNAKRQRKLDRYREQKVRKERLADLKQQVDREHVDDEVKRQYYTEQVKSWVSTTEEELEAISDELEILKYMSSMKKGGQSETPKPKPAPQTSKPFRPFILTKSSLQKRVYGAGYPSLPTYTVEEFFDQQAALGNIPQPGPPGPATGSVEEREAAEAEAAQKEAAIEGDDPETLAQARNWDEWRDDHRTGWGNTHNKG